MEAVKNNSSGKHLIHHSFKKYIRTLNKKKTNHPDLFYRKIGQPAFTFRCSDCSNYWVVKTLLPCISNNHPCYPLSSLESTVTSIFHPTTHALYTTIFSFCCILKLIKLCLGENF